MMGRGVEKKEEAEQKERRSLWGAERRLDGAHAARRRRRI